MKKIYVNYDDEFYVTQYSFNDVELKEAFMEDDFEIKFGYTRVKEVNNKLILYNDTNLKSEYYYDEEIENAKQQILSQINDYKRKLAVVDYMPTKIVEAYMLGEDTTELINEYKSTLLLKKEWRSKINELEEQLKEY